MTKKITSFNIAMREAKKLLKKLQNRIDKDSSKFCENYGQKEIIQFKDKLELSYNEYIKIVEFLQQVSDMAPKIKF